MRGLPLPSCPADPAADTWSVVLWEATAALHRCSYSHRHVSSLLPRGTAKKTIEHLVQGAPADVARASGMAIHFCKLVRQLAEEDVTARAGPRRHARRGFERGCAAGLRVRLEERLVSAEGVDAASAPPRAGQVQGCPGCLGAHDPAFDDTRAVARGRAAAGGISLVLRVGLKTGRRAPPAVRHGEPLFDF